MDAHLTARLRDSACSPTPRSLLKMPQIVAPAPKLARPGQRKSQPSQPQQRDAGRPRPKGAKPSAPSALPSLEPTTARALLQTLYTAFKPTFDLPDYQATLRFIKRCFAERDYAAIFGPGAAEKARLSVYAADYAGGRAVGYCELWSREDAVVELFEGCLKSKKALKVVCLGAGTGAEAVAVAGLLLRIMKQRAADGRPMESADSESDAPKPSVEVICIDYADYSDVFASISAALAKSYPDLAAFTSFSFQKLDLISSTDAPALDSILASADFITLNFTLNEILAQSKAGAAAFLQRLSEHSRPGTIFCSIDSAGSFSDVAVGSDKVYPAPMFLSLLSRGSFWKLLVEKDSEWWRLEKGDREDAEAWYPARVEDFRCFVRVLRRRD